MNKDFTANARASMPSEESETYQAAIDFLAAHKGRHPPVHFIVATTWSSLGEFSQDSGEDAYDFVLKADLLKDNDFDKRHVVMGFDGSAASFQSLCMLHDSIGLNMGHTRTWTLQTDGTLIPFNDRQLGAQSDVTFEGSAALLAKIHAKMGANPDRDSALIDLPHSAANAPWF